AGFDVILVETVGVGQAEVEIAGHADTTVVLSAPGLGDAVQAAKAGVLEIAGVLVVNKADRDGARVTLRELRQMVAMKDRDDREWKAPIVRRVGAQGEGIDGLWGRLEAHPAHLESSGELAERRRSRARTGIEAIVLERLRARLGRLEAGSGLDALAAEV